MIGRHKSNFVCFYRLQQVNMRMILCEGKAMQKTKKKKMIIPESASLNRPGRMGFSAQMDGLGFLMST